MAVIRWEPVGELNSLQTEMNRLFSTFFDAPGNGASARRWVPPMDLVETPDHFVLRADLPGLTDGDVRIELEDNVLTISGDRKTHADSREAGFSRVERPHGSFARSLTLPEGVDPGAISATFDKGVLEVCVPKPEQRKPHRVSIAVGASQGAIEGSEAPASSAAEG